MSNRTKLWVGIGACVLLGSQAEAAAPPRDGYWPETHSAPSLLAQSVGSGGERGHGGEGGEGSEGGERGHGGEGGERRHGGEGGERSEGGERGHGGESGMSVFAGGEGGEGGGEGGEGSAPGAATSPGVFATELALMKGHLQVARLLYEGGHADAAAQHLRHPLAEHHAQVRGALVERGIPEFTALLRELSTLGEQRAEWSRVAPVYRRARASLESALTDVPEMRAAEPAFLGQVITALLRTAVHEYEEALDERGEGFRLAHEYQDALGFVVVAGELLESMAPALRARDAGLYDTLQEDYQAVRAAWPGPTPPRAPAMSASELAGAVARFELHTSRI